MNYLKTISLTIVFLICANLKSQTLSFTITNLSPTNSITCANPVVNLTAASSYTGGPVSYTWTNGVAVHTGTNVSISTTGNYTVIAYASTSTNTFQVVSIGINTTSPTSTISPLLQNITCNQSSITSHTATSASGLTHLWVSPQGGTAIVNSTSSSTYNPGGVGTYTHLTINPVNGCAVAKTFTVTSSQGFPSFSLVSSPANFTLGCSNILTISIVNAQTNPTPGGAVSYILLPPGSSSGSPGPINSFTINTPGTWNAAVLDQVTLCATRSAFTVVQYTTPPTILLNVSSPTICSGNTVVINASGANTYTFTGGISNGVSFTPGVTSTYSVTGTSTVTGCSSTSPSTIAVTVNPSPTVTINASSTSICMGNTVSLSGAGTDTYSWSGGITNGQGFSPTTNTTYTVTGTNTVTGCSGSASQSITVNPLPVVTASASSQVACPGGTVILSGAGATSYVWSGGVTNNVAFSASVTTTYTVTGTDTNGCTDTDVITITVTPAPQLSITASDPIFCAGMTTTLTASGANTYTWIGGGNNASQTVNPVSQTVYTVMGTTANNCTTSGTYTQYINISTSFNYTVSGMVVTLKISQSGCNSFVWDFGNNTTNTINPNPVVTYTAAGIYGVCLKCDGLPNACVRCFNLTVPGNTSGGVGIEEVKTESGVLIYPNPSNGELNVEMPNSNEYYRISVFNYLGQTVSEQVLNKGKNTLSLNSEKGIYHYRIVSENGWTNSGSVIIEK